MRLLVMLVLILGFAGACDSGGGMTPEADATPDWGSWNPPQEDVLVPPGVDTTTSGNISIDLSIEGEILSGYSEIVAVVHAELPAIGVEFYVDKVRIDTDLIPPYDLMLNTALFPDGEHQISVYTANDVGGYASATVSALFDNTPPTVTSIVPQEGQALFFEDGPLHMAIEVNDVNPLTSVEFRVNGLLVADFPGEPYEGDVPWDTIYVDEDSLPKNLLLQYRTEDFHGLVSEVEFDAVVHRRLAWRAETLGEIWATAALLPDGNIVFGNLNNKLTCLSPTGLPVWEQDLPGGISVAPAVDSLAGRVFVGALDGKIYGFTSAGGQIWSQDLLSPAGGGLAVYGSAVIVATYDGKLRGLSSSAGTELWSVQLPGLISSSPTAAPDGTIYIGTQDGKLYAVDQGTVLWSQATGGEIWSTPSVGPAGTIFVGSNDGWLYAVNPGGDLKWLLEIKGQLWGRPLVASDGSVYIGSTSKYLTKVDAAGIIDWTTKLDGISYSSPVMDSYGVLYIGTTTGRLFAVDSDTGEILWSYQAGDSIHATPVLTPQCAAFGCTDRSMYCVRTMPPAE